MLDAAPSFDDIPLDPTLYGAPVDISTSDLGGFGTPGTDSATSIAANTMYGPQDPSVISSILPGVNPLTVNDPTPSPVAPPAPTSTSVFGSAADTVKSWYNSVTGFFGGGSPINSSGGTANIVQPGGQSGIQSRLQSLFGTGSPASQGGAPQGANSSKLLLLGVVALAIALAAKR